jgi:hypothetical protein
VFFVPMECGASLGLEESPTIEDMNLEFVKWWSNDEENIILGV